MPSKLSIGNEKMLWPDRKLQQGHTRALAVTLQCCQPGAVLAWPPPLVLLSCHLLPVCVDKYLRSNCR